MDRFLILLIVFLIVALINSYFFSSLYHGLLYPRNNDFTFQRVSFSLKCHFPTTATFVPINFILFIVDSVTEASHAPCEFSTPCFDSCCLCRSAKFQAVSQLFSIGIGWFLSWGEPLLMLPGSTNTKMLPILCFFEQILWLLHTYGDSE